jgi:hypothetical protein
MCQLLTFRSVTAISFLCLLGMGVASARVAHPAFVDGPVHSPNLARVHSVHAAEKADFVILDDGALAGFDVGMVLSASRENQEIAELLIIKTVRDRAAALILSLSEGQILKTGDTVRIKTF